MNRTLGNAPVTQAVGQMLAKQGDKMVNVINWLLTQINSRFAMIDIQNIEFVCNWCENTDVDCSVVGHPDGVIVVYVRSCQSCGGKQDA